MFHCCSLSQRLSNQFNFMIAFSVFHFFWLTQDKVVVFKQLKWDWKVTERWLNRYTIQSPFHTFHLIFNHLPERKSFVLCEYLHCIQILLKYSAKLCDILGYDSFAFINCGVVFFFYLKRRIDSVAMFQADNATHFRWHRTPPYCNVLRIEINNKIKYFFFYIFPLSCCLTL